VATGFYLIDNKVTLQYGSTRRFGAKASGTIVLHDAEGGTDLDGADMGAENVATFIRNRTTYGSYHDLVDRDTHIPMAPIDSETWHSIPDNPWSVGICVAWTKADLPRMTYAQRRSYYEPLARVVLLRVADFAARGITVPIDRMLTAAETQARKPGISTHSRTDPSRRSDPFGTGSQYETEFLAVLAELAANPTTQEDDLTPEETAKLNRAVEIGEALVKYILDPEGRGHQADDRVLGALPNRRFPAKEDGSPGAVAMVLDQLDGQVLRNDIATVAAGGDVQGLAQQIADILRPEQVEQLRAALVGTTTVTSIESTASSTIIPAT
jgi:hypothetical protein